MPFLRETIPTEKNFYDTSFFQSGSDSPRPQLPSPAEVREQSRGGNRIVRFEHLNLIVKFGGSPNVKIEEAHAIQVVKESFANDEIPVPELFGWRIDGDEIFIYMSLIDGSTLYEVWPRLTQEDKTAICTQLRGIVVSLKSMEQPQLQRSNSSTSPFIGSVTGGEVQDIFFHLGHEAGPFHSIAAFNDWVQATALPTIPKAERATLDPYRSYLPDLCNVYFTHGDIHLHNILISNAPVSPRIVGLVDWGQAGWYPEYWEYCKLNLVGDFRHEWREAGWSESIVDPWPSALAALSEYWSWVCP